MTAVPAHPVARTGATSIGVIVTNRLKVYAVPAVLALGLHEVVQPANTSNRLTA
jgi:hypothetical protein